MTSDSIPLLEVNALSSEVFLAINRIRHLWRQRADANSIFKEITKIEQYQSITKDFLQDHIDKLITDEKIIKKINRGKNSYKVNIELIDEIDQQQLPLMKKHHRLISLCWTRTRQKNANQSIMKRTSKLEKVI